MKNIIAWLLLTIYTSAASTAMWPVARDIVAHIFWHQEHMEQVHHGTKKQDHLVVEMAQMLEPIQNQQAIGEPAGLGKLVLSAHVLPDPVSKPLVLLTRQSAPFPQLCFGLPKGVKAAVFLPPKPFLAAASATEHPVMGLTYLTIRLSYS